LSVNSGEKGGQMSDKDVRLLKYMVAMALTRIRKSSTEIG